MSWEYKRRFFQMHGSKKGRNISATASFNLFITQTFIYLLMQVSPILCLSQMSL